jgi:hypothetical protein
LPGNAGTQENKLPAVIGSPEICFIKDTSMTIAPSSVRPAAYERAWIPPQILLLGQLAHGTSWLLLLVLARRNLLDFSFPGLAWLHLVVLGYLTLVSLAVLFHVLPAFTGQDWRHERLARASLWSFAVGTALLVLGFWLGVMPLLALGGTLICASLGLYLGLAALSMRGIAPDAKAQRALARAFSIVMGMLALTVLLGLCMALSLVTGFHSEILSIGPALHAHWGLLGWLTLLVMGVSMRTFRRISGNYAKPNLKRHIFVSSSAIAALLLLSAGFMLSSFPLLLTGSAIMVGVAVVFCAEAIALMHNAPEPHKPPLAFLSAGAVYFPLTALLGLAVLLGHSQWRSAYLYLALTGFLMQIVNGHLHHIGIRLLATITRGQEDDTEPMALLKTPLSWLSWALFQLAVIGGTAGFLLQHSTLVVAASLCGFLGWGAMMINGAGAWRQATGMPAIPLQ